MRYERETNKLYSYLNRCIIMIILMSLDIFLQGLDPNILLDLYNTNMQEKMDAKLRDGARRRQKRIARRD